MAGSSSTQEQPRLVRGCSAFQDPEENEDLEWPGEAGGEGSQC